MRALITIAALLAAFNCFAKQVIVYQVIGDMAIVIGTYDVPFQDNLEAFREMSDCSLYMRWDADRGVPFVMYQGERKDNHAVLSCIGTEGAEHSTIITFDQRKTSALKKTAPHDGDLLSWAQ